MNFASKAIGVTAVVVVIVGGSIWLGRQNAPKPDEVVDNGQSELAPRGEPTGPSARPKPTGNTKPTAKPGEVSTAPRHLKTLLQQFQPWPR